MKPGDWVTLLNPGPDIPIQLELRPTAQIDQILDDGQVVLVHDEPPWPRRTYGPFPAARVKPLPARARH